MELNVSRFFSDRVVFDEKAPGSLRVTNSLWDWLIRIVSWIWSPAFYSDENRRTIQCFKKYLVDHLGPERLQRICTRYSIDFDQMEKKGSSLLSRDVAKIAIGASDVTVADIPNFQELSAEQFKETYERLANPFPEWRVPGIKDRITGRPSQRLARFFYDPFLADRERLQLCAEHKNDSMLVFVHNMAARVIKREMNVGMIVPAPQNQFYYVSAKLVTADGMVSYCLHPVTRDTKLDPIRFFRGTAARNSEIDGISSVMTDLEKDLGRTAYESGLPYEGIIEEKLAPIDVEAGHSLGGAIVEYRLANMNHIKKAYLLSAPGIPEAEVKKFNLKNQKVKLVIRQTNKDTVVHVGDAHLGFQAPHNVIIDFKIYHPPRKTDLHPHVTIWGKEKVKYGIEGGILPKQRDVELYHKGRFKEKARSFFGPPIARSIRCIRAICRKCFWNRADMERGLKIGTLQNGHWRVEHYRT